MAPSFSTLILRAGVESIAASLLLGCFEQETIASIIIRSSIVVFIFFSRTILSASDAFAGRGFVVAMMYIHREL